MSLLIEPINAVMPVPASFVTGGKKLGSKWKVARFGLCRFSTHQMNAHRVVECFIRS